MTTIAWRMVHIAIGIFGGRATRHVSDGSINDRTAHWPRRATGGVALLDHHHSAWLDGVRNLDLDGLARPCRPSKPLFAESPMVAFVLHVNREALHDGAKIALMLDLFTHLQVAP